MTVLVHFSGPSYSKSVALQAGAAPVDIGRDPQAAIHLPDNDRLISRRHLTMEWCEGGVRVSVLSKVNGLTTPRGECTIGDVLVLGPGDTGRLGLYSFVIAKAGAEAPAANPPTTPAMDMPAAPQVMSANKPGAGFSGGAPSPGDPRPAFGVNQPPVHSSASTPSPAPSGLGAAQLPMPQSRELPRRRATDHVEDVNPPVRPGSAQATPFATPPAQDPPAAVGLGASDATPVPAPAQAPAKVPPAPSGADPWGDLEGWAPAAKSKPAFQSSATAALNDAFDDAFSSSTAWRLEDMPATDASFNASFEDEDAMGAFSMPDRPPAPATTAQSTEAALRALCKGLGISGPSQLRDKDWEQLGRAMRQIVQGLSDVMNVRAELKKQIRAIDRTMLGAPENNPLKSGMPLDELLQYLLFMPQGAAGYTPVKRALEEAIADLRAHEFASLAAVRAVVEGSIKEFDPVKLRTTLMKGKRSFAAAVDNARLWDLYTSHYEHKGQHMKDWLEQVFNHHFMPAYSRESERLRREALPPTPNRTS